MIGPSFDEVHRELVTRDPAYEAIYRETAFEDELALGLAELRHERHLTQRQLAEKLTWGQPMIARIEKGAQIPTATTLFKLATALQAKIEITPAGATVSPYVSQQHAFLPAVGAMEYTLVPPMHSFGYQPAGAFWFGSVATWATVNTGQIANQERLTAPAPMLPESIQSDDVIGVWVRSLGLNQEPIREPVAAQQSLSAVTERPAA